MKASEYQVSVPPQLKDFKLDGRGQTSLNWRKFKNKFEDVAKITRVEQLFEKDSAFRQWRRTINDAIRSIRDVSASTEIRCKDIMIKMSEQKDGEIDYVTNLQRRASTFLADLRIKSTLNFWLIQNLDIHSTNHHQLGSPVIPPSTMHVSQFAHEFKTDEEMNEKFLEFLTLIESEFVISCISLKKDYGPAIISVFRNSTIAEERTIKNATTE
jgi:hypothetical protein